MADPVLIFNYFFAVIVFAGASTIFFINENRLWQLFEYSLSGTIVGYLTALMIKQIIGVVWEPFIGGAFWYIIAIILGLLMYSRYIPGYEFMARWPISILVGSLLGVVTRAAMDADIIGQITPMITVPNSFDTIAVQVITIITMIYFVFTFGAGTEAKERASWHSSLIWLGRLFIMIAVGGAFSNKFMGLMSSMINRINLILFEWPF
jgi:hypothetical protein